MDWGVGGWMEEERQKGGVRQERERESRQRRIKREMK